MTHLEKNEIAERSERNAVIRKFKQQERVEIGIFRKIWNLVRCRSFNYEEAVVTYNFKGKYFPNNHFRQDRRAFTIRESFKPRIRTRPPTPFNVGLRDHAWESLHLLARGNPYSA